MYVWVNKKKNMTTEKQSFQMYLLFKMLIFCIAILFTGGIYKVGPY